jgi:hypothetical protein
LLWNRSRSIWLAGGNDTTGVNTNTLATSTDGITWTALGNTTFSTNCHAFASTKL